MAGTLAALSGAACNDARVPPGRTAVPLWFTYGGRNREVLEKLILAFNTAQHRYYVRGVFQGDYFEGLAKLRTAIAARAAPAFSHVIGEVIPFWPRPACSNRSPTIPARASSISSPSSAGESWVNGGRQPLVALPFNRSTPIAYLNGEIFAPEKRSAPRLGRAARIRARADGTAGASRFTPRLGCPVSWWFWVALVVLAGGEVVEPDGRVSLGDDAGVRALEFWKTLVPTAADSRRGRDTRLEATNQGLPRWPVAMIGPRLPF